MKIKTLCCAAVVMAVCAMGSSVFAADMIDNPAYVSWAKYKPGTMVSMEQAMVMNMPGMPAGGKNGGTVTTKLIEVTPEKAVVEVTMKMTMNGQVMDQPAAKHDIPAKVEKGDELLGSMSKDGMEKPTIKDMKEGKDTIEIKGKKLDATTKEFTMEGKAQGMDMVSKMKIWYVAEVPGGMAKSTMEVTQPMAMTHSTTVVDYTVVDK